MQFSSVLPSSVRVHVVAQMILAVRTIGLSAFLGLSEIDPLIPEYQTLSARTSFVQVLQVVGFLTLIGVRASNIALSTDIIPTIDNGAAFVPLVRLAFRYAVENGVAGVCACLVWFRLFTYLSFIPRVTFVQLMFHHAMSELVVFTIIVLVFLVQRSTYTCRLPTTLLLQLFFVSVLSRSFFTILLPLFLSHIPIFAQVGMANMGYLFFSTDVYDFRSFYIALLTVVQALIAGIDEDPLIASNRYFGVAYVVVFRLFVTILCLNGAAQAL
jgi:hypothetical protein